MIETNASHVLPGVFKTESELQALAHSTPEVILSGIPEIDPQRCPDVPTLHSLGREISLLSGPIDNLYVDVNAILTFVECKRYGDSRLKREVYPQAVNYASDLQATLMHYQGAEFIAELERLLRSASLDTVASYEQMMETVSGDRLLEGRNIAEWKRQFRDRLEFNIKNGIFRVIVLCGPSPADSFSYSAVRNLIRLMQFTERNGSRYDMLLMDLRLEHGAYRSSIIWRRYAELPQIPLVAHYSRDVSAAAETLSEAREKLPDAEGATLNALIEELRLRGVSAEPSRSMGYVLKWSASGRESLYIALQLSHNSWSVYRHQIHADQEIFARLSIGACRLGPFMAAVSAKATTVAGQQTMYELRIPAPPLDLVPALAELIVNDIGRRTSK